MVAEAERLAAALGRREEAALAELYDRYGGTVYALALRMTGDPGTAEEIALDAFLQVWEQVDRFDARQGSLEGWLFTIARSRAIDRLRAAKAVKRTRGDEQESDLQLATEPADPPDRIVELIERQHHVRAALSQLNSAQRAALDLAYFQGLSHSQIADRLGEPVGTVKTRIRQAMLILRKVLTPVLSQS